MNKIIAYLDNEKKTIIFCKKIEYYLRFYNISSGTKNLIKNYFIDKRDEDFYVKNKIFIDEDKFSSNPEYVFKLEDRSHCYSKTKKLGNSVLSFIYKGLDGYVELEFYSIIHNANGPALINASNGTKEFYIDGFSFGAFDNETKKGEKEEILKQYKQARDVYVIKNTVSGEN